MVRNRHILVKTSCYLSILLLGIVQEAGVHGVLPRGLPRRGLRRRSNPPAPRGPIRQISVRGNVAKDQRDAQPEVERRQLAALRFLRRPRSHCSASTSHATPNASSRATSSSLSGLTPFALRSASLHPRACHRVRFGQRPGFKNMFPLSLFLLTLYANGHRLSVFYVCQWSPGPLNQNHSLRLNVYLRYHKSPVTKFMFGIHVLGLTALCRFRPVCVH